MNLLTGVRIALIGGDARQLEVIRQGVRRDATVTLMGYDDLPQTSVSGAVKKPFHLDSFRDVDALILPIVATDDEGRVESLFSSERLVLTSQHLSALPRRACIYTGMAKPYLRRLCREAGVPLVELLERDDVAIYNSIPTVEGALMLAIQNTDITIHHSRCTVLGFGRTGMSLVRALMALGAKVKVGVRREEHFARAFEMGAEPFYTSQLEDHVSDTDILFNTVPAPIVTSSVIAHLPAHTFILDLASSPGGTDFRFCEKRGIRAVLAPSLPGIVAPKTAGQIYANSLFQLIGEQVGKQEGKRDEA